MTNTEQSGLGPVDRVLRVFECVRNADPVVADLYMPNAELHAAEVHSGREAIRAFYQNIFDNRPTQPTVLQTVHQDKIVVAFVDVTFVDGRSTRAIDVFVVDGEGISSMSIYYPLEAIAAGEVPGVRSVPR